jgi:hypothetical protein
LSEILPYRFYNIGLLSSLADEKVQASSLPAETFIFHPYNTQLSNIRTAVNHAGNRQLPAATHRAWRFLFT